ncbi:MAG: peroxiredoxin family protein [Pseudomonadales bacterium]
MKQFVQLQENLQSFHDAGIQVVGLTYDAPELQQTFIDKHNIQFPFLSDVNAVTVHALGILNGEYKPGDDAYGIPYPGIFVVNSQQKIVGKIFINGYEKRVSAEAVLAFAKDKLN